MIEIIRRFVVLALILVGGALFLWPGDKVMVVKLADFERGYTQYKQWKEEHEILPFEEYKFHATKDRRQAVSGDAWTSLFSRMGQPEGDTEMMSRRFGYFKNEFAFFADEAPFDSLKTMPQGYVLIDGTKWLSFRYDYPQEFQDLPYPYWRPLKWQGVALVVLGLCLYAFLPRRKWGADAIRHSNGSAVVSADLLGLMLAAGFGLLPCLIIWDNVPGASILSMDGGWGWLTIAMWLMALCGLALLLVGLHYSRLAYFVSDDGLRIVKGGRESVVAWDGIEYFQSYESKTSSRLGRILILFGGSLHAAGLGIAMQHNNEVGIRVHAADGRIFKIMANGLSRFDEIEAALKSHGVKRKRKGSK
ncbi:hypothetical protein [Pseudodesulfovibrio sp. zrk46]|uniref:hypothetical protein n=1 Tax=Pseudodesulfovibrio sp. zrk46 TaxID=2725288 RepID=UPI0014499269|nr:hypothetical protein [Pseudodesulfovibrio sp. zrk46]QJB56734.1 hypothetical protein HFN16_10100 [Pseudodesulfovibrio sp. zrk46]